MTTGTSSGLVCSPKRGQARHGGGTAASMPTDDESLVEGASGSARSILRGVCAVPVVSTQLKTALSAIWYNTKVVRKGKCEDYDIARSSV